VGKWGTKLVKIVKDKNGKKIVTFEDVIFCGKRSIPWGEVEAYLACYAGHKLKIKDTGDIIQIGRDFSDEFAGSTYTRKLKGALAKAKANIIQGIPELVAIAEKKRWNEDFNSRHKKRAEKGWYRYNTRFALPVKDEAGNTVRYNNYQAVLIIRHASDNKMYLYDIQNIKKETSNPS